MAGSVQLANGVMCVCGNIDAVKFRHYRNVGGELLGSYCLKCNTEYLREDFFLDGVPLQPKTLLQLGMEKLYQAKRIDTVDSGVHMVKPEKTKIEKFSFVGDYLKPGDHVAWQRPYIIWHHALVVDVDQRNGRLKVIHWHGKSKSDCRIVEEWLTLKDQMGTLYRMDYEKEHLQQNPLQLVLARARSRLGDSGYQFFGDNCEAFVTYCKKGVAKSQQVTALLKALGDRVKATLSGLIVKTTKKAVMKIAKASFEVPVAEGFEKIANNCQWVGFGLVIFIEGYLTIYDLKELYDSRKEGKLTRKQFMEEAAKRLTEAICTAVPAAFGGLLPGGIGIAVGTIGAVAGKIAGAWIGSYVGEAVTKMIKPDDKAVKSIDELHLGDHIVFYGNVAHPRHHGIVLWHDDESNKVNVIHSTYEFGVRQEWIKFKPPFYKVMYKEDACHPPEKVCERATSKFGTKEYNLLTNNCKHFAEWCKKK